MAEYNRDIQALRALAIAITFVAHLDAFHAPWLMWTGYFWLGGGVDLFFAISGYLITTQLLRAAARHRSFGSYARQFWIKRFFRLWPVAAFWATLFTASAIGLGIAIPSNNTTTLVINWIASLASLQNLHLVFCTRGVLIEKCLGSPLWPYWSLSLEEQFYLIFPAVIFLTVRRRGTLIVTLLAFALVQSLSVRPWGTFAWFFRSDAISYGCVVALCWDLHSGRMQSAFSRIPDSILRALLLCMVVLLVVVAYPLTFRLYMGGVALAAGAITLVVSGNRNLVPEGWIGSLLSYLGERSYSFYLVHFPILAFAKIGGLALTPTLMSDPAGRIVLLGLAIMLIFLIVEGLYRWIETPSRAYGRALAERPNEHMTQS